jgi:pimeloyl-ACP methyl ester carboxylesterase
MIFNSHIDQQLAAARRRWGRRGSTSSRTFQPSDPAVAAADTLHSFGFVAKADIGAEQIVQHVTRGSEPDVVVSADGTAIAYQTVGKGPAVLVVPGALAVSSDFAAFARELADRFTVHTMERRGRGESGAQGDDYSIDSECEDVAALQAATGATLLFGHSFGGLIALEAARRNRAFAKVAVYEPGVSVDGSIDTSWAPACRAQLARGQCLSAFITFARGINPQTTGRAPRWLLRLILPAAIRKREREQKYQLLPAAIREHEEVARLDNTYARYRDVTAEVLLMAGKDATATGAGRASRGLLPVLPKATLAEFPALDHFGPEKKPKQVAEAVSAFFVQDGPSQTAAR